MVWKVISAVVVFVLLVFGFILVFDNLPGEPVELEVNYLGSEAPVVIEYGIVPVFEENLRFSHDSISYSIGEGCDEARRVDMINAFDIFSDRVGIISFYETSGDGPDISVGCSDEFIKLAGDLFTAGEGGPSKIINTSGFKIIEEGRILLYKSEDCNYPIVALHELGHVFGFDHSGDPSNIMYNTSNCDQRMSDDMVELIRSLYSIEPLADARISNANAVVRGRYLDFNISILNEGLRDIGDLDLTILVDGKEIENINIGKIEVGFGRTLRVENMRIPRSIEKIEFIVDVDDLIRELNEDNNAVEFVV